MAAAAVVPLLAYGAASLYSMRNSAREQVFKANQNIARRAAEQIDQHVSNNIRILRSIAANIQETGLQRWQQERLLRNSALQFPEFTELTLTDEGGTAIVTSRIGDATIKIPGSNSSKVGDVMMSPFEIDDALLPTAILAIPINASGSRLWLIGRVSLEELWRMVDRIRVGQKGFALVVTGGGQLLAHGEPRSKSLVAQRLDMLQHPLLRSSAPKEGDADGADEASGEYSDDWSTAPPQRNLGMIVGVRAGIQALGWNVLVEQPSSEAFAEVIRLQNRLGIAIALALFAMLSVGYFFGRSFINPILRLTRGTRALAEGKLDERVIVDSKDELGQLGTAFNNMADRLVELQDDLIKKERQATFGRVAVGLVHDLSNPIMNIGNACKMIVMSFDDMEYRQSFKRTVERELAQIKRMLDDLRNIAKPVPLESFPIEINRALAEVIESMQTSAATSGLTLESDLVAGQVFIKGDLFALNRVCRNLITNAFQATVPGGRVTVRTRRENEHAIIDVADTGSGIPKDRLDTIFDDFVTTKKRGLGLGLAISKKVVEQLGGTIGVTSEVGTGTTFTLRFPLTQARPEQLAS